MKKALGWILVLVSVFLLGIYFFPSIRQSILSQKIEFVSPLGSGYSFLSVNKDKKKDYSPYSFENLAQKNFSGDEITLGKPTRVEKNYSTYVFTYKSDGKTISGMANIPNKEGKFPVVVLLRGYADQKTYHIGLGTERSANFLADNGFLTLAPDFLGYGYSDWEDQDILMARFYRPVEVLNLIASINSLSKADENKIGLWGHSNGGQIALSILEITGRFYPTSLWAPVSLGFPECVLTYLGTQEEVGNPVREKVDEFLLFNDPRKYSITEYFDLINAPFIIHQATADELIKTEWSKELVQKLENHGLLVDFYLYQKENHNFNYQEKTGETLRQRDLDFFKKWLK